MSSLCGHAVVDQGAVGGCEATRRSLKDGYPEYHQFVSGEPQVVVFSIFYSYGLKLAGYFEGGYTTRSAFSRRHAILSAMPEFYRARGCCSNAKHLFKLNWFFNEPPNRRSKKKGPYKAALVGGKFEIELLLSVITRR